ncbi:N-acetylmuramoyl-L-alanine amidase [Sphingobacterium siyangense]|uniref:N-acetylmuramoyl-L-alanine amidase n=2 Tax=Sphingobacterium siyangense TaxID=459529 RepID=A0A562MCA7_9SPHI|nr:N-acetylmuramoyl-L-alanine amidase [Sphingobacterium siyangense]
MAFRRKSVALFMNLDKLYLTLLLVGFSILGLAQSPRIIQKPITWDKNRIQLSLDYLKNRHGLPQSTPVIHPKMVVVHWTANNSVKATFNTFNPVRLPGRPELTKASALNVSSQFVIDRDGTIYQFLPDSIFARHTIGLNYCAIGIENIGSRQNPLTDAQLKANEELIRYLSEKYPIEFVLGHHEYQRFKKTSWWKETDPNYITGKDDPGDKFMNALRKQLADLKLNPLP